MTPEHPKQPGQPKQPGHLKQLGQAKPTAEQLGHVFRSLADKHAEERARASRERTWKRLSTKWQRTAYGRLWHQHAAGHPATSLVGKVWSALLGRWPAPLPLRAVPLLAAVVFSGGASLVAWQILSEPATLSYEVRALGDEVPPVSEDGWIRTEHTGAALGFSDGSEVEVAQHSSVHVDVLGLHSARARLAHGKLSAHVLHADTTRWMFVAGPYEVQVIGTRFDLAWEGNQLLLNLREGQVKVLGPDRTWLLRAGESLRLGEPQRVAAAAEPASDAASANAPAREAAPDAAPPPAQARTVHTSPAPRATLETQSQWQAWLKKGRFDAIVSDAKSRGLTQSLHSLTQTDLVTLAQAAGYTGEASLAAQSWRQVRTRFAKTAAAARAAFYLARFAEQQGNAREALDWLDAYGREAPAGVLAAEALGRKLTLVRRLEGERSRSAVELSKEYLRRFPSGAYAETARASLSQR